MSDRTEQLALARRLTVAQMEAMERSISHQDRELARLARKAIDGMKRGNWSWQRAEVEIDKLFARREDLIAMTIRDELKDSAAVSKRVMAIYDTYKPTAPIVTEAEIATAQKAAAPVANIDPAPLSKTLHRETTELKKATKTSVKRSIREFRNSDLAGKDLIQTARAADTAVGNVEALPKALNNYVEALKKLDPDDIADTRKKLNRYMKRLVDKRMGYREFVQIIDQQGPEKLEKAVSRWMDEKQRYHAERITRTEMAAEHRQRQLDQWRREKRVVGVVWTLNGGARRGYVRRTPVPKSGKSKGSRCACEANAGKEFTLQYAADHTRMGHPHCKCFWVPVYAPVPKRPAPSE